MTFVSLFQFSLFLKKRERRRDAAFLFGQIYKPAVIVLKRPLHAINIYPWVNKWGI